MVLVIDPVFRANVRKSAQPKKRPQISAKHRKTGANNHQTTTKIRKIAQDEQNGQNNHNFLVVGTSRKKAHIYISQHHPKGGSWMEDTSSGKVYKPPNLGGAAGGGPGPVVHSARVLDISHLQTPHGTETQHVVFSSWHQLHVQDPQWHVHHRERDEDPQEQKQGNHMGTRYPPCFSWGVRRPLKNLNNQAGGTHDLLQTRDRTNEIDG